MDALIFDLDGTLIDTLADIGGALNRALAERGLPGQRLEDYKLMVGNGFRNLAMKALPEYARNEALIEELRFRAQADYAERCLEFTVPYPGIPELLAELGRRGLPLGVLSNKPHELTLKTVEGLFPSGTFALVRGETPEFPRKPDPAAALFLARALGASPAASAYLGDSDVDMATARAAGMRALGAGWGFRGAAELRAAGAEVVLEAPGELLGLIDG